MKKTIRNAIIKALFKMGMNRQRIAGMFGISRRTVYNIAKSKYVHPQTQREPRQTLRKFFSKLWDIIYGGDAS